MELSAVWPLVGRDGLLERITAALRSPAASVVVLCGPSGVGKTRLASEAAATLEADGWLVIPVTASETMSAIPLGALAPALAREPIDLQAASRDSVVLFEQVRRAVEGRAEGRRVVILIDDLSLLDSLSLAVVTQLLAAGAARLIATVRNGDPLPDAILSMWTSSTALRIDVPPLDIAGYEDVLAQVLTGRIAHRTAVDLHAMSGGNPLFLRELVLGALAEGQLVQAEGVWQLVGEPIGTPALHDLIRSRMQHLDAVDRAIVERLAVCQPLALADLRFDGARKRVIALEQAGLVEVVGDRLDVSLAHPQYVAAVRASLSRLEVLDNLLEQAEVLSARTMTPEDELRVAVWRLDAGEPSDPGLLSRAAYLALLAQDHEAVSRLASAALLAGAPAAEMLFLQGEAQWTMGRNSVALELLDRAAAADEGDPTAERLTGLIATARASTYAGEVGGNRKGLELLDDVQSKHPGLASSLALSRAVLLLNLEEAGLAAEQLVTARPNHDSPAARDAILAMSTALPLAALGRADAAITAAREAVAYATAETLPVFPVRRAQMVLATTLIQTGQVEECRALALASLHDGMDHDDELAIRYDELLLGRCALALGRLDTAARWFRDVVSGAKARGPLAYRDQGSAWLALALAWQGRTAEATAVTDSLAPEYVANSSVAFLAVQWVAAIQGDRAAIPAIVERARAAAQRGHRVLASSLLHGAARLGGADLAMPALVTLGNEGESPLIDLQSAHVRAEAQPSVEALVTISERWEALGQLLFAAEAMASAAGIARKQERGREAAGLQKRADALASNCEGAASPLLQFLDTAQQLTKREREVSGLAAQGLSSVEIAERLFLSPRTVDNHLQSSYAKLGIRSRSELTGR
ncbi:MAG: hypothetical protein BGO97_03965 [Micrococcales bacterium 70-64]|nr:AAA family ATPase [Leifsonia sp.]ODU63266.1 MAG: hypothetical protein ABT06_03970 [Leifsonia sp. SCN 70-46]OJX84957.1 MAG: hypothetical protein BGO97_03965 [Micrococcales bacterium 70-64]